MQRNGTQRECKWGEKLTETNPESTQKLELAEKAFETVIMTIFHMFEKT